MADKYFAGYKANDNGIFDNDRSLINDGQLRKVLMDSDAESTITTGSVLSLEEGYELRIKQIDLNGNKVYLALAKDGEEVDSKVVSPEGLKSATYQYKVDIAGERYSPRPGTYLQCFCQRRVCTCNCGWPLPNIRHICCC